MGKTKMFDFITDTINPIGGECKWTEKGGSCKYCWATALKERLPQIKERYSGEPHLIPGALKKIRNLSPDDFAFVVTMRDMYNPNVPLELRKQIYDAIALTEARILLLTKNPAGMLTELDRIPDNVVIGATIESDFNYPDISGAPPQNERLKAMYAIKMNQPRRPIFVSVEPILNFDSSFLLKLIGLNLWACAVGYDNYGNNLPEPSLGKTMYLIEPLEKSGTKVYRKTLREDWVTLR